MSNGRRRGRPSVYDWDLYTNGDIWTIYQERDFFITTKGFRALIHRTATSRNIKVETKIDKASQSVSFRFLS